MYKGEKIATDCVSRRLHMPACLSVHLTWGSAAFVAVHGSAVRNDLKPSLSFATGDERLYCINAIQAAHGEVVQGQYAAEWRRCIPSGERGGQTDSHHAYATGYKSEGLCLLDFTCVFILILRPNAASDHGRNRCEDMGWKNARKAPSTFFQLACSPLLAFRPPRPSSRQLSPQSTRGRKNALVLLLKVPSSSRIRTLITS